MKNFILDFFASCYLELIALVFLFIIIRYIEYFSEKDRLHIVFFVILSAVLLIVSYADGYIEYITPVSNPSPEVEAWYDENPFTFYKARFFCASVGYMLRPVCLYVAIFLLFSLTKWEKIGYSVPLMVNTPALLGNSLTHRMFYISKAGIWHEGPLLMIYQLCFAFYYLLLVSLYIRYFRQKTVAERITIAAVIVAMLASTFLDVFADAASNSLTTTTTLSLLMYYLCTQTKRANEVIDMQKERLELQKNALLNSQIQPHFIYNTLNTIKALYQENTAVGEKCLDNFSQYLRSNAVLARRDGTISVEEELANCKLYSDLEQVRFENLIVEYRIFDGKYQIPFLTIQPFIENAVRHGVRNKVGGKITVLLCPDVDQNQRAVHKIEIFDNGTGKSVASSEEHHGIGIANVTNRVRMMCGGRVDVNFTPNGTTVTIMIPVSTDN